MKRKDAKEHSTTYKVGGLGLETLWRVSKNFPTELSVKYSTVHVLLNHIHITCKLLIEFSNYSEFLKKYIRIIDFWVLCKIRKGRLV